MQRRYNFFYAFRYAFNGLLLFFRNETNGKIQLVISVVVVFVSFWLNITSLEWIMILICIAIVISLEMLNSALEKLCDMVEPNQHPVIKIVKDIAAASVLFAAIISAIAGIIIFLPKLLSL